MGLFKVLDAIINPVGALIDGLTKDSKDGSLGRAISGILNPADAIYTGLVDENSRSIGESFDKGFNQAFDYLTEGEGAKGISKVYDDFTGKSQTLLQNKLNRELAEEEYQRNLQAIGDTAAAYEAAGFNRNLMYGGSSQSYSAPQLQAYSGSAKLDTMLSRIGKVLNFIPSVYQASAALESIDQAREKTKQSEIKTMADGINLINSAYGLGHTQASYRWVPDIAKDWFSSKRHFNDFVFESGIKPLPISAYGNDYNRYIDAALKNKFDLLESIGISNTLRNTRNSYLGYQYELDRRFGGAGRIVGMASQGLGAASKLVIPAFFGKKSR